MIDLLDLVVYIDHVPFGHKRVKEYENSPKIKKSRFSKAITFNDSGSPVRVTSLLDGKAVSIRCCPLKPLQGHNVFGSNDVCAIASAIICKTLGRLNIPYAKEQREAWMSGDFIIRAIDITHRFCLPEGLTSFEVCQHLLCTSPVKLFRPQWLNQGTGVRLHSGNSGAEWLFYEKRRELLDKRMKARAHLKAVVGRDAVSVWHRLLKIAGSTIRAELKLEEPYLTRHHLNKGHAWTAESARALFLSELQRLPTEAPISVNLALMRVKSRPQKLALLLWASGRDPHTEFPPSTFRHHRQAIVAQAGIDIARDVPAVRSVKLSGIFCQENVHGLPNARAYGDAAFMPKDWRQRSSR